MEKMLLVLMSILLISCGEHMTETKIKDYFMKKTAESSLIIDKIDSDGLYHIEHNGFKISVSLDNIIKNSIRDDSFSPVDALISSINAVVDEKKDINKISTAIYPSMENTDIIRGDEIQQQISDQVKKCYYVYINNSLIYITKDDLLNWNIAFDKLQLLASNNLDKVYETVLIKHQEMDGHKLFYIESDFPLKSTILFSSLFQKEYLSYFKGKIYAVFPTRDFCYFFSEDDKDYFFPRIGGVVIDEFNKSGYSITKEVFEITENSSCAIGSF